MAADGGMGGDLRWSHSAGINFSFPRSHVTHGLSAFGSIDVPRVLCGDFRQANILPASNAHAWAAWIMSNLAAMIGVPGRVQATLLAAPG